MTTDAVEKLLLRIPEVVDATGYSRSFIYEQIAAGGLKAIRNGRTIRVRTADLKAWIDEQE
jgi:excisionase family DNA binding protein